MKTLTKKMGFTFGMIFSLGVFAVELPKIEKPLELTSGEFSEGTITQLSNIDEFLPWAQNAKKRLESALIESKRLSITERVGFISEEIKTVVRSSGSKQYQMLMRFALNRGLMLVELLDKEADKRHLGVIENQLDVLSRSIVVAIDFYESDIRFLDRSKEDKGVAEIDFAKFGMSLGKSLIDASKNVLDASAQYQFLFKSLEVMNWDLSQDNKAYDYAETIVEIYRALERLPRNVISDEESMKHVRTLNYLQQKVEANLNVNEKTVTVDANTVTNVNDSDENLSCGLSGTIDDRIKDCSSQLNARKEGFVLVARTKEFKEVHKELKTGLLWGDRLRSIMDHFDAERACTADLAEVAGIRNSGTWRLPSQKEFEEAEKNGIWNALPNMDYGFWSSSVDDEGSAAWLFGGRWYGNVYFHRSSATFLVRCVAL